MSSDPRLFDYYERKYREQDRLDRREGQLERARTQELLTRFLPTPPARILDVGGGAGVYARWLTVRGYDVHLLDIVPSHVQQAERNGIWAAIGDARALPVTDGDHDAALLFGPLYHLLAAEDRQAALHEAQRAVRPGGLIFAAFISRGGVVLDGFVKGWIDGPGVMQAVWDHMRDGLSVEHAKSFGAIAYFHLPSEARAELAASGLEVLGLYGIEGPGWVAANFEERWVQEDGRLRVLEAARMCEEQPELLAMSPHLLAVCRRP